MNANETSMSIIVSFGAFRLLVMIWPLRLNNLSLGTLVAQAQSTERARLLSSGRLTTWSFHHSKTSMDGWTVDCDLLGLSMFLDFKVKTADARQKKGKNRG